MAPLLQYHMVPMVLRVADLQNGQTLPTLLSGQNLNVTVPPAATAESLGIQSFSFVTINGEEGSALIVNEDIKAGKVTHTQFKAS